MADMLGFWSYVHADDQIDLGRIVDLAHDIVGNYEAIRAESIELFLDRDDLQWGDKWRAKVDDTLGNVAFFIPVVTPRYFKSVECRRELQFFKDRTEALGVRKMILPILYIDVPALREESPRDPLMAAIKDIQWEPWMHLRNKERTSEPYRDGITRLAGILVERVTEVEQADTVAAAALHEDLLPDGLGALDRMAALEETMPRWTETLSEITTQINSIGEIMRRGTEATNKGDKQGKGFAARLAVARRVASELAEPVDRIQTLSQGFVQDLDAIDGGVRAIIEQAHVQDFSDDPESLEATRTFLGLVTKLSLAAHQGLGGALGMVEAVGRIESMSKDLRGPMRSLRTSLTSLYEAREITDQWVSLVEGVGLREAAEPRRPVGGAPEARS